jgi:hypothetical protein
MFFPAFSEDVASRLPKETIFTVEYLTSQILVNSEPSFLEEAISRGNFIEALLQELEFFGQLRKDDFPDVREYLVHQQSSLQDIVKIILKERDKPNLRRYWLSPLQIQTT